MLDDILSLGRHSIDTIAINELKHRSNSRSRIRMENVSHYASMTASVVANEEHESTSSRSSSEACSSARCDSSDGFREKAYFYFYCINCTSLRSSLHNDKLKMMFYGQLLSLGLSASGAANDVLVHSCSVYAPTFQMAFVYLTLALAFWTIPKCRRRIVIGNNDLTDSNSTSTTTTTTATTYQHYLRIFVVALCDVEANYLAYLSFQYASFKTVTLLMSLAIPSTMISSAIILKRNYTKLHCIGASICFIGSCLTVLSDANDTNNKGDSNATKTSALGDLLAICGAFLYGLEDTLMEWALKNSTTDTTMENNHHRQQHHVVSREVDSYMCQFGLFGAGIAIVQVCLFERTEVFKYFRTAASSSSSLNENSTATCSLQTAFGLTSIFVIANALCYIGGTRFLLYYEAAMFNLSLLTSNGWAVLFTFLYEEESKKQPHHVYFFLSLVVIVLGVIVYEIAPSPVVSSSLVYANSNNSDSSAVDDEDDDDSNNYDTLLAVGKDGYALVSMHTQQHQSHDNLNTSTATNHTVI